MVTTGSEAAHHYAHLTKESIKDLLLTFCPTEYITKIQWYDAQIAS